MKKAAIIMIVLLTLTGCYGKGPKVDKSIQKSENDVIQYVNNELQNKYSNITVKLERKEQATTHRDFCIGYCEDDNPVKGAHKYIFSIKDKEGNYAIAEYTDGFKFKDEYHDNELIESYQNITDNTDMLERYSKIIQPYTKTLKVLSKYYSAGSIEEGCYDNVRIIYNSDYNFYDLDYNISALFNIFGYDMSIFTSTENNNNYSFKDPTVYVSFKDKMQKLSGYGLENYEQLDKKYTNMVEDSKDYYSLRKYFNSQFSEQEIKEILNVFNNKAKPYINRIKSIRTKTYDLDDGSKKYIVVINNYTKNNILYQIRVESILNNDTKQYEGKSIAIMQPSFKSEESESGTIIRTWYIKRKEDKR